jgi:dolichol kinase
MVSYITLIIISGFVTYICFLQTQVIKYSKGENEKLYGKILLFLFIAINLWYFINVDILFPADIILILGYTAMISFFWIYHLIIKYVKKSDTVMRERDTHFQDNKSYLHEFLRKFFHFFTFGGSLLFVIIFSVVSIEILKTNLILNKPVWFYIPGFASIDINLLIDPDLFFPLIMQAVMALFFMIALPFAMIVERFRLDPEKEIPFHGIFTRSLRESEEHNAADYYFFSFGIFLSAVLLPAAATFGVLCVLCFGDTFAGLVGKKSQKHRHPIKFENEKCWEGAFAGFFFTVFTAFLFVGWFLALILGIIFIIIDVITPQLLKVSDNILYPITSILVLSLFIYVLGFKLDGVVANFFTTINQAFIDYAVSAGLLTV